MGARGKAIAAMLALFATGAQAAPGDDALFGAHGYRVDIRPQQGDRDGGDPPDPVTVALLRPDIDAILIDVLPAEGGHREADGRWRLARERPSIPGAHWFPEAGRGDLSPAIDRWFQEGLARLTGGARDRMIITFCLADCWMGWNAARRLRALGYTNIWWLAEGTDGWRDLGRPLINARPEEG